MQDVNRARAELGLKPIVIKKVPCLCCQLLFESLDYPRQRLCTICRSNNDIYLVTSFGDGGLAPINDEDLIQVVNSER